MKGIKGKSERKNEGKKVEENAKKKKKGRSKAHQNYFCSSKFLTQSFL